MATPPEDQTTQPVIQYVDQNYKDLINSIATSVNDATGETYQVEPTTEHSQADDGLGQFIDRVVYNRPGHVESKSFLDKVKERVIKKNPGAVVREK